MLKRKNSFLRLIKNTNKEQILVANIDYIFIVVSKNDNINKLIRIILSSYKNNITPVVIINKSDLDFNKEEIKSQVNFFFKDIKIIETTKEDVNSLDEVREILKEDKTAIFIGSSGVGKSTLTNILLKDEVNKTNEVSKSGQGKHTTTSRNLFLLKAGGVIIDTPGVREFNLKELTKEDLAILFKEIFEIGRSCKYTNCTHINEGGCMVKKAVETKELSEELYNRYLKIVEEILSK